MNKFILAFLIFPFVSSAQVFKAGDTLPVYINVSDTFINGGYSTNEVYYFDLNNDQVNDFYIQAYSSNSPGGGTNYINIYPMNADSYTLYGRKDSVYHNYFHYWMYANVAKPLSYGDPINSMAANWQSMSLSLTNTSGSAGTYIYLPDWISTNDLYIGLKHVSTADTIYGWIRVNCPSSYKCLIKDVSYTGQFVGIKEIKQKSVVVYPNPATNILYISGRNSFENSTIEIINYLGQTIIQQGYSETVDVSKLTAGIYTLKIIASGKQVFYSKFIKE